MFDAARLKLGGNMVGNRALGFCAFCAVLG
jgi:hypothetical protein